MRADRRNFAPAIRARASRSKSVSPRTDNTSAGFGGAASRRIGLFADQLGRSRSIPLAMSCDWETPATCSWIPSESVHLIITSPQYWTLKKYEDRDGQLGDVAEYEAFLDELDKVWSECLRVLVSGGRICCVVGDVCIPRRRDGRHRIMPLHSDIQVRARRIGLDCLTPILWHKIANGVTEVAGNGAGFYGKPYQPGAIVKNRSNTFCS